MAITRAEVETVLITRSGKTMALVSMDNVTIDGTNTNLIDPIATALMEIGIQPQSVGAVTDADLASLEASQIAELLVRAERRLLVTIQNSLDLVDISLGPRDESLGQIGDRLAKAIERLDNYIAQKYGDNFLTGDTIRLDFAEKGEI